MACSRIPKCRLRPPYLSASKSPAASNVRRVLVDGERSAEPPISEGKCCAMAFSTLPEESRVARPFVSAAKLGRSASHPRGSSRFCNLLDFVAKVWVFGSVRLHKLRPALLKLLPTLADAGAEVLTHAIGDEKLGVFRPAIAALRQTDLFDSERFAMRGAGVVLMGRAVADMAVDDNQSGYVVRTSEDLDRLREPLRSRWRRRRAARSSHRQGSAPQRRR